MEINETGNKSTKEIIISSIFNPVVIVALITTIFGTLAITIITKVVEHTEISLSNAAADKNLQFKVIESLMNYTTSADLDSNNFDILKLQAFTMLINDNDEFKVKLKGFQNLIDGFYEDELIKSQGEISILNEKIQVNNKNEIVLENNLNAQKAKLNKLWKGGKKEKANLQRKIDNTAELLSESRLESKGLIQKHQDALMRKNESEEKLVKELEKLNLEKLSQEKLNSKIMEEKQKLDSLFAGIEQDQHEKDIILQAFAEQINSLRNELATYQIGYKNMQIENDSLNKQYSFARKENNRLETNLQEIIIENANLTDSLITVMNEIPL